MASQVTHVQFDWHMGFDDMPSFEFEESPHSSVSGQVHTLVRGEAPSHVSDKGVCGVHGIAKGVLDLVGIPSDGNRPVVS